MQSIFRLPWCSDQLSEKHGNLDKMRPMVGIPALKDLKRKRADTSDAVSPGQTQPFKKQEHSHLRQLAPAPTPTPTPSQVQIPVPQQPVYQQPVAAAPPQTASPMNLTTTLSTPFDDKEIKQPATTQPLPAQSAVIPTAPKAAIENNMATGEKSKSTLVSHARLRQVIENEFNMQILMKHNELRLIEQELAKCQIALEQLRRCELRPYPGATSPSLQVSEGVGAAVAPLPGYTRPSHPAPYGVTDGPYSRHYRQWLLHDPQFDSISPEAMAFAEAHANAAGRSTRNQGHHVRKSVSKYLGTSTRSADPMQSIPNYPAPSKDKSAPLVLKRSTDGQLVKLICNNCHRGNFSSIQGFLNHCRIAHKVDYKSHDAAAIDCGQLLDADEKANLPSETHAAPAPRTSVNRTSASAAPTPAKVHPSGFVHPLNSGTGTPAVQPRPAPRTTSVPVSSLNISNPTFNSTPFKPSGQAPRLSQFMAKQHAGGDLDQAVAMAKQRVDLKSDDEMMSPDIASDPNSPVVSFDGGARTLGDGRGYFPLGQKGMRQPAQRPRPVPLAPTPPHHAHLNSQMSSPQDSALATFSPNAADSNPGMISDHDDDDHSVSEEDHPQPNVTARPPLSEVGRTCSNEMDIDIEDEQIDGITRGVIIRRNSMLANNNREATVGGK